MAIAAAVLGPFGSGYSCGTRKRLDKHKISDLFADECFFTPSDAICNMKFNIPIDTQLLPDDEIWLTRFEISKSRSKIGY